jgi:FAD/FMN-containing dehydrogenase
MTTLDTSSDTAALSALVTALSPVEVSTEQTVVRRKSRDFFWFSPILNDALKARFGDIVAMPATREELKHCLSVAFDRDLPIVLRGGGTGNYGQAVPLHGGLILDMTRLNRILEIGDGYVRAEAGARMASLNAALHPLGRELAMFPSTQDLATVGGFVAGGSAGIGSVANGPLRQPGNLLSLSAMSVEGAPQETRFEGIDALRFHHAWGCNGVLTEITLRTVRQRDWIGCMASFPDYGAAYAAGYALSGSAFIGRKLASVVDRRIVAYFPRLSDHIPADRDLLVTLVPREDLPALQTLVEQHGGTIALQMDDVRRVTLNLPHVFEFSYNHTTLQVLKSDRSVTYQQIGGGNPADVDRVVATRAALGDDVWSHHEFARLNGQVIVFDLPVIRYTSEARLRAIDAIYEAQGFTVYDAHCFVVEGGGMQPDYTHLATKKRMDPKGLLNPGKSKFWNDLKHLSADEIAAHAPNGGA